MSPSNVGACPAVNNTGRFQSPGDPRRFTSTVGKRLCPEARGLLITLPRRLHRSSPPKPPPSQLIPKLSSYYYLARLRRREAPHSDSAKRMGAINDNAVPWRRERLTYLELAAIPYLISELTGRTLHCLQVAAAVSASGRVPSPESRASGVASLFPTRRSALWLHSAPSDLHHND